MKLLIALALSFLVPITGYAKCASTAYRLSGTVTDPAGHPVAAATVKASWIEIEEFTQSAATTTDAHGRYQLDFLFYPWSGQAFWIFGDLCQAELSSVSVVVTAAGRAPLVVKTPVQGTAITANYSYRPTAGI